MPKVRNPSIPQDMAVLDKSAHANRDIDAHYDVIKYMFQESLGGLISVEQDGDDCIRPNADLEMKSHIRSEEQLKHMYSEYWMT